MKETKYKKTRKTQEYALQFRGIPRFFAATAASTNFFNFQLITFVVFLYNPTLSLHLETLKRRKYLFYECIKLMFPRCNVAYGMSSYYFCILFYVSKFKEEIVIFLLELHGTIYPFHGSVTLHKHTQFVKVYT